MIVYYDTLNDEIVMRSKGWNLFFTKHFPHGNLVILPPYRGLVRIGEL